MKLSFTIPFSDKKIAMVRTKSRATNLGHKESRDASSHPHPHRDRQSAPAMQPSSVHVQSMAATKFYDSFLRQNDCNGSD